MVLSRPNLALIGFEAGSTDKGEKVKGNSMVQSIKLVSLIPILHERKGVVWFVWSEEACHTLTPAYTWLVPPKRRRIGGEEASDE